MTSPADTIRRLVAEHYSMAVENITDSMNFIDDLRGDEIDAMILEGEVESAFHIEISEEETADAKTVGDLCALVERKLRINSGHA